MRLSKERSPLWIFSYKISKISRENYRGRVVGPISSWRTIFNVNESHGGSHDAFSYQWPSQKDFTSFMSNQRPENSTPSDVQLCRASFHHSSTSGASQSGKTWNCIISQYG